jgi:hypothetical protein
MDLSLLNPEWEWYDNSTLNLIDSCIRKAYWKLEFPLGKKADGTEIRGIADRVGVAAHFGSAIHSAMDKMYSPILVRDMSYEKRKLAAFRGFSSTYAKLILEPDLVESPYDHPSGIRLLDDYFNHYAAEDDFYVPIETEMCTIVVLHELSPPAYFIARQDGLVFRPSQNHYLVKEYKTTKGGLQQKLDELRISRQAEGYVWSLQQFESQYPIAGVLADILAVRVRERDPSKLFARDIFNVSNFQLEQWYQETLTKIRRWREIKRLAYINATSPLTQHFNFDRSTNECLRYGKCSYYDLCVYGLAAANFDQFSANEWNPLYVEKMVDN